MRKMSIFRIKRKFWKMFDKKVPAEDPNEVEDEVFTVGSTQNLFSIS